MKQELMPENLDKKYNFAVWGTQGGSSVREDKDSPGTYIFVTDPGLPGLKAGSVMPEEWDIQPANKLARDLF